MKVISNKEFVSNQERYFDDDYLEPDDDLRNAITMEEVRERIHEVIHNVYAKK